MKETTPANQTPTVTLIHRHDSGATAITTVDPDDPMFAGHYPEYPVLPGVCLIEAVDQAVRAWAGVTRVSLTTIQRCRFLAPVRPGDVVTVELTVTGPANDLRCVASVETARGPAAHMRLIYRTLPSDRAAEGAAR